MTAAGLRAFEARDASVSGYSYEQIDVDFAPEFKARLDEDAVASAFFAAQPARYRRRPRTG